MINLYEIESTIELLKRDGSTVNDAKNLALLYLAREQMKKEGQAEKKSEDQPTRSAPNPPVVSGYHDDSSEFIRACEGKSIEHVLDVLDEHMEAIRILYPKEYEKILVMIRKR